MYIKKFFEKNKTMESLWLLIVLFLLILLIIPLFFRIYLSFDPLNNEGMVVIKLFFINIVYFSFQLTINGIIIRTKKERKQLEYKFSDPKIKFYELLTLQLKQKVKLKYINIYSKIGTGDAYHSAMLSGLINIIYHIFSSYLKNLKYSTSISVNSQTLFNEKVIKLKFYCNASICLFDILYCFFTSLFLNKKRNY